MRADVEIFHKAVRYALDYGEFFNPKEIAAAAWLKLGAEREGIAGGETILARRDRPARPRLPLAHRRLRAALRPHCPRRLEARRQIAAPALPLVPRPRAHVGR
jgi:hypothetical protein